MRHTRPPRRRFLLVPLCWVEQGPPSQLGCSRGLEATANRTPARRSHARPSRPLDPPLTAPGRPGGLLVPRNQLGLPAEANRGLFLALTKFLRELSGLWAVVPELLPVLIIYYYCKRHPKHTSTQPDFRRISLCAAKEATA